MARTSNIEKIANEIGIEKFKQLYLIDKLSLVNIGKELNCCNEVVKKLVSYFNLSRNRGDVNSTSLNNSGAKKKQFQDLISRISKEDILKYYIEEDHGYYESIDHFNTTDYSFNKLCNYYNIKKDRSKVRFKILDNMDDNEKENYWGNIIKKQQETRIKNSGSLKNSYLTQYEKIKNTLNEKYNVSNVFELVAENRNMVFSKPNEIFKNILEKNSIDYIREFKLGGKSFDFKVDDYLIEINPYITHNINFNPFDKKNNYKGIDIYYHRDKSKLAQDNGYKCIHLWDWDDWGKIINIIKGQETIYARKCEIKEIKYNTEVKNFLNKYHFQGWARCSVMIGLYYNNELISVMTFGKPRYNNKYEWELIRYCSNKNVIGGAKRLFKYFLNNYKPTSIISYCDNSKFIGDLYLKLNFIKLKQNTPSCHWFNGKDHITDSLLVKQGFSRLINHCESKEDNLENMNNKELMLKNGFFQIYDCGQSVYVWENSKLN